MDFKGVFFDTNDYEQTSKKIGEGSFGQVFVVEHLASGEEFAAKIIKCNEEFSSYDQMMFLRESTILHKLKHPAIVKLIGINLHSFDNPDKLEPTIITEYLSHGSLKEILKKEQNSIADDNWSPTKKYICLLGIADAMRYLHRHGIIHRDLKPENILVDGDYYPRVCDFGLSRCFSKNLSKSMQLSMTGKIGTPLYMAPEMMEDDDHYGPGIDVYAFAILAYEIVSGQEPFSENGKKIKLGDLARKVMSGGRPKFTDGVTDKMKELIENCWCQDYKARPSFDDIFEKLSSDFTYIDEDVDKDEIIEYLETLEEDVENVPSTPSADEIVDIKNENEELRKEKELHEAENKKLKEELSVLKKETETANNDIKKLKDENTQLKKEKEATNNDIKKLKDENAQLKKEKEATNNDIKKLKDENAQLKKEKEATNNDIKKLKDENAQLKKEKEIANSNDNKLKEIPKEDKNKSEAAQSKKDEIKKDASNKDESIQLKNTTGKESEPKIPSDSTQSVDEINTMVIDNGSHLFRIGIAGYDEPHSVIPSVLSYSSRGDIYVGNEALSKSSVLRIIHPIEQGNIVRWNEIENLWDHAFKFVIKKDPAETPVLLSEPPAITKLGREKMCQIMFETFNVPSYYSIYQEVLQLYSTGRNTGIVLNSGKDFTSVVPIDNNRSIDECAARIELGGSHLTNWLKNFLLSAGYSFVTSVNSFIIDDIKEKVSYVTLDYKKEHIKLPDVSYTLPDSSVITISDERLRCPEILFQPKKYKFFCESLPKLAYDSMKKCQIQKEYLSDIILCGGSTLIEGFQKRFDKELRALMPTQSDINIVASEYRNNATWVGGSILAMLDSFPQIVITADAYLESGASIVNNLNDFLVNRK